MCDNSLFFKYADDLTILHFLRDQSEDNLHVELKNVIDWSVDNKLCVNSSKSFVMNIVTKKSIVLGSVPSHTDFSLFSSLQILGCHLSNDLKWIKQVDHAVKKASRNKNKNKNKKNVYFPIRGKKEPKGPWWDMYLALSMHFTI